MTSRRPSILSAETKASRPLRQDHLWPGLLARPPTGRGRRALRDRYRPIDSGLRGWLGPHGFNERPMDPSSELPLPLTDQELPTLLDDLEQRGLLDDTDRPRMGEFGRTPRQQARGRDHWPQFYTILMAGGGIKRGFVHGASDKIGAYPDQGCAARGHLRTFYELLGIDPETEIAASWAGRSRFEGRRSRGDGVALYGFWLKAGATERA